LFHSISYAGGDEYVDYALGLGANVVLQLLRTVIDYIDIAVCSAWSLCRKVHGKEVHELEIRRWVAFSLLDVQPPGQNDESAARPRLNGGIPSKLKQLCDPRRSSDADDIRAKRMDGRWPSLSDVP
jgi:hypothetical protein